MGGKCTVHEGNDKAIQNFVQKISGKGASLETKA
jgi:hypothetical protein